MAVKLPPALQKRLEALEAKKAAETQTVTAEEKSSVLGNEHKAPAARRGESAMSSRGFQFQRLFGLMSGQVQPEHAKVEVDLCERLRKSQVVDNGFALSRGTEMMAPLSAAFLGGEGVTDDFRTEIKQLLNGGHAPDWQEMAHIVQKSYNPEGKTNQSWIDETLGGAWVAPEGFGDLIQLLRNKDAIINAGAQVVPMPPQGRIRFPRVTTASLGYWVGENASITATTVGSGSLTLSAKKVGALVSFPNELLRFASPMSEMVLRADMTKTLSLTMDKGLLEGDGSDVTPLGILNTPSIATVTPTTTGGNGNTLAPEDLYLFPSAVEANNGEFEGWVLRPELFYSFVKQRAATNGQFVYSQFRGHDTRFGKELGGYKAVTTPQVSITRVKGTGTNLTYVIGAQWSDYIIAMFGAIEFALATQGDTAFAADQTVIRSILTVDGACRHPGVFAVADTVLQTIANGS